jgi:hypothetical protein
MLLSCLLPPRHGVNRDYLFKSLQLIYTDVFNLFGGGASAARKRLPAYLEWTSNAVRMLGGQMSHTDLDRLVLNRRHELLLAGVDNMTSTEMEVQRVVNGLVALELDQRVEAFDAIIPPSG